MNFVTVALSSSTSAFVTPLLTNADHSRFLLSGGATYTLPVSTYTATYLPTSAVLFQADGAGTVLSVPNLTTLTDNFERFAFASTHTVEATRGGVIEFPSLSDVEGPAQSDETLRFVESGGGTIDLSALTTTTGGSVQFSTDRSNYTLAALTTLGNGRFEIPEAATLNLPELITWSAGSLAVPTDGTANLPSLTTFSGSIANSGQLDFGSGPAVVQVTGTFSQTSNGELRLYFAEDDPESIDRLLVSGLASLDGTLRVTVTDEFSPTVGSEFEIVAYGTRSGEFASITGNVLANGNILQPDYRDGGLFLVVTAALRTDSIARTLTSAGPLSADQVSPVLRAASSAVLRQRESPGESTNVTVHVTDLPGDLLAVSGGSTIWLDANGAGHGWFVDSTPDENAEFELINGELRATQIDADQRIDLLTVLAHEFGHLLGREHDDHGLMQDSLMRGVRRLPSSEIDSIFTELATILDE